MASSVLDPSAHQKIIENPTNQRTGSEQSANERPEAERAKSPYQLWRERRASSELSANQRLVSDLPSANQRLPSDMRTPTPDPDYDNLSYKGSPRTPRAPREHSPNQKHPSFDDNSSDTSFEDHTGRYTPRSNASEYGRNIPRYQPMPNLIMGYGRGRVSPATSEASLGRQGHQGRSPSTESFFGKNGANVQSQGSSSQLWYQKYKHSSFSAGQGSSGGFGEPLYGAFDGRISKFRGKSNLFKGLLK